MHKNCNILPNHNDKIAFVLLPGGLRSLLLGGGCHNSHGKGGHDIGGVAVVACLVAFLAVVVVGNAR